MLRLVRDQQTEPNAGPRPIPFPTDEAGKMPASGDEPSTASLLMGIETSADDVLSSIGSMSRRIDDLARQLNCLGYFEEGDGDDRPSAA